MPEPSDIIKEQQQTRLQIARSAGVFSQAIDYARKNGIPLYAAGHRCYLIGDGGNRVAYYPVRQTIEYEGRAIRSDVIDILQAVRLFGASRGLSATDGKEG
jgi:hypothetical protein